MQLIDKSIQLLSKLQEMMNGQLSKHPGMNNLVVILEDLKSLLTDSVLKQNSMNGQNADNFIEIIDSTEDCIHQSIKQALTINMERAFEACESICAKNNSGTFKKVMYFIKNKLVDDPEDVLNQKNDELLINILEVRVELKQNNYAINYADISQEKAHKRNEFSNKRGEGFTKIKQQISVSDSKNQNINKNSETIKYEFQPITHEKLQENQDNLKRISFNGIINFQGESSKEIFSFTRTLFTNYLENSDIGRISRNHASIIAKRNEMDQISYFLINNSQNGSSVLRDGSSDWIKIKGIGEKFELQQNDIIGILFDLNSQELILGFKFCV